MKTPAFYLPPKIHKPNNPGRPTFRSDDYNISRISELVDHYLQPAVTNLKSHVKDMNDFIKKIENVNNTTDHSYLVSLEVRSLYTNIPHTEGIEVVRKSLQKSKPSISISIFIKSLGLILLNNVIFNGVKYLQKKGCALGKCTPSYENLLMSWFEEHFIYAVTLRFSKFYLRYIDDIFLIRNGTKEEFSLFT